MTSLTSAVVSSVINNGTLTLTSYDLMEPFVCYNHLSGLSRK